MNCEFANFSCWIKELYICSSTYITHSKQQQNINTWFGIIVPFASVSFHFNAFNSLYTWTRQTSTRNSFPFAFIYLWIGTFVAIVYKIQFLLRQAIVTKIAKKKQKWNETGSRLFDRKRDTKNKKQKYNVNTFMCVYAYEEWIICYHYILCISSVELWNA